MLAILLSSAALAASIDGGVQVAAFQSGFEFVEERFTGEVYTIEMPLVSQEDVACYDEVGIRDLNVEVPIQSLSIDLMPNSVVVDIMFGRVHGSDMTIYGTDGDSLDLCPGFDDVNFHSFELTEARVLVELVPALNADGFEMDIIGEPTINGNISTDIDWVPDGLILSFAEDAIFDAISAAFVERVPAIASSVVTASLFAAEIGDVALDVALEDLDNDRQALAIGMDVEAEWRGDACVISGVASQPAGRSPRVDFGARDDADVAVGVTEYQLNRLFHGAWADGLLCFDAGPLSAVAPSIEGLVAGAVESPELDLALVKAPRFTISDDGIALDLEGLHLSMVGEVDGEPVVLLSLDANLNLDVEVAVDHAVSSFSLSLTQASLDITGLTADPLFESGSTAQAQVQGFVEGWAMDTLSGQLSEVPIYGNLFRAAGAYLRVSDVSTEAGAVIISGELFNEGDEAVDTEAPDTLAQISGRTKDSIQVRAEAEDNSSGPFAFSWRLDSGSWSAWSGDAAITIPMPETGEHVIEVRARDAWLNVDPTPDVLFFDSLSVGDESGKGCQCASSGASPRSLWVALPLMLMGVWRRRA